MASGRVQSALDQTLAASSAEKAPLNTEELGLAGLSKAQIRENIPAAVAKNELPMPEAGAMSYMISNAEILGDSVGLWCALAKGTSTRRKASTDAIADRKAVSMPRLGDLHHCYDLVA